MNWQSPTIGVSFAFFVVWMERQGRWTLFMSAIGGKYVVGGSRSGTQTASTAPGASGSTTPTAAAKAGASKYGLPPSGVNTTNPNKPIYIAPSGQPISGTIGNG